MKDLEKYLYDKIQPIIKSWLEHGIYAISFFVYSNEAYTYKKWSNVSEFQIGYNTEIDCKEASRLSEERWNFAFWRQDMTQIITPAEGEESTEILFKWYEQNGIANVGFEDHSNDYDGNGDYIGKGPVGYYELLGVVSNVARELQQHGVVKQAFGKEIPIIVHDLEYPWYVEEATENANPNGEADDFLEALRQGFPE